MPLAVGVLFLQPYMGQAGRRRVGFYGGDWWNRRADCYLMGGLCVMRKRGVEFFF